MSTESWRRNEVRDDPDVAGAIDVDAERVLVLAVARVQVASLDDPVDLEPDTRHRATRQLDDVRALEERVEVDSPVRRRLLEERIGVVPRPQVSRCAAEPRSESLVERAFPASERPGRWRGQPRRASPRACLRRARPSPARARTSRGGRGRAPPRCAGARARGHRRRRPQPTVLDASHASRRSAGSSLWRRMRLISVSPTSVTGDHTAMA